MTSDGVDGSLVSFAVDESTVTVRDELEGGTQVIETDAELSLKPAIGDLFVFPVDNAVSFHASEVTIGRSWGVNLRGANGDLITEVAKEPYQAPRGTYFVEINGPLKTYIRLPDVELTIEYVGTLYQSDVVISLSKGTAVTVGARPEHGLPEATITVPDDPAGRMEAFSYLGSSIKEFSPERSWPTLRGHPPQFERGEALEVPDSLTKPDTGIVVTVPETQADVYRVAPLAFYFGASVEPGDEAMLQLANGYTEPLSTPDRTLEESVRRIITRCFMLDTLARQDGYVPVTPRVYESVGPYLPFYPESLASESLSDQMIEYFEAPDDLFRERCLAGH